MSDHMSFLNSLNELQKQAVTAPLHGVLQIIAGPGTGKTTVLTSRVAYLLLHYKIEPESIIVTTFTKKAANEMKERLNEILKDSGISTNRLIIGTFHSICIKILRKFGYLIKLPKFTVASEEDCMDIIKNIVEHNKKELLDIRERYVRGEFIGDKKIDFDGKKPGSFNNNIFRSRISGLKSNGWKSFNYIGQLDHNKMLSLVYNNYEQKLKELNLLDFDDLLLITVDLLKYHKCLKNIDNVLIDEFQDTNTVQLQLMREFGLQNESNSNNITIVGDPDQSIYAFRNAQVGNFKIMETLYSLRVIHLLKNYRSTKEILDFSENLMHQQKGRDFKTLEPNQRKYTFPPVFSKFSSVQDESKFIATEIKILTSLSPELYKYSDFAILIRAGFLGNSLEKELIKRRIPYKLLRGHSFWERKEVSLMIDFFRTIAFNKTDIRATIRILKEFSTGIGAKGILSITHVLEEEYVKFKTSPLDSIRGIIEGTMHVPGRISKQSLISFMELVDEVFKLYDELDKEKNDTLVKVFEHLLTLAPFKKLMEEKEERKLNLLMIKEYLLDFKAEVEEDIFEFHDFKITEDEEKDEEDQGEETLLEKFLISVHLYLTSDDMSGENKNRVVISTIHASKGLEWPIVFIPGLSDSIIPIGRAETVDEIDEERRVFYVSTTRAKHLLYLCYAPRGFNDFGGVSPFITKEVKALTSDSQVAFSTTDDLRMLYKINEVLIPENSEDKLAKIIGRYKEIDDERSSNYNEQNEGHGYRGGGHNNRLFALVVPRIYTPQTSFTAAREVIGQENRNSSYSGFQARVYTYSSDNRTSVPAAPVIRTPEIKREVEINSEDGVKIKQENDYTSVHSVDGSVKRRKTLGVRRRV